MGQNKMKSKAIDRFIIHAGMHKTGSTAAQEELSNYRGDELHYLRWNGSKNHSIPYLYAFADGGVHARGEIERRDAKVRGEHLREKLKGELNTLITTKAMLSGEAISAPRLGDGINGLKDFLTPWVESFDVIAYMRPPRSYAAAEFSQSICSGGTPSLPIRIDYNGFNRLDEVFGQNSVSIRPYIRSELAMGDAVIDLCCHIGIPATEIKSRSSNSSPSIELLALLWEANLSLKALPLSRKHGVNEARYRVIRRLANFGSSKLVIGPTGVRNYGEVRGKISSFSDRIGLDLGAYEDQSREISMGTSSDLKVTAIENAPLLIDHIQCIAETENLSRLKSAISELKNNCDLTAAQHLIVKMIEIEMH